MKPDLRPAPDAVGRDRDERSPRASSRSTVVDGEHLPLQRELRLPRARRLAARARAAHLLLQRAARRLPALHRARLAARDRPRPARPRPAALARGRRARALVARRRRASTSRSSRRSPTATRSTSHTPWRELDRGAAGPLPPRHRRRPDPRHLQEPDGAQAPVHDGVRGARRRTSSAATARPTRASSASGSRSTCRCGRARCATARGSSRRCSRSRSASSSIYEFTRLSVTAALRFVDELELTPTEELIGRADPEGDPRAAHVPRRRRRRLPARSTARPATLSGGEAQRLRLATQIGSQLVGVLYILDEPSIGLHQRDNDRLIGTLERLRDLGNTVLVVEHDEQMMRDAPTGSSTWGRARASTAARSSRRARPTT